MSKYINKDNFIKYINIIIYVIFLITYLTTLEVYGMGNENSRIRYYILILAMAIAIITLLYKYGFKLWNKRLRSINLLLTIFTAIVFLILSINKAMEAKYNLNFRTVTQISLFLLPAIYIFALVNIFETKTIINLMKITCIILVVVYFCEPVHNIKTFFIIENWKAINFFQSNSFTESHICSEAFLQLFLFFYYYYLKAVKEKSNTKLNLRVYTIICFVFTILSFKRLGMLFAIGIFVLGQMSRWVSFLDFDKRLHKITPIVLSITFVLLTIFYTEIIRGTIFKSLDVFTLTTGRDYILSLWEKKNYLTYGYGSSLLIIGRYLEMDLIQIYLELNVFALFLFCYTFFKNSSSKVYPVLIMLYAFLNMLTASSLPYSLSWILLIINISCIEDKKSKIKYWLLLLQKIKRKVKKIDVINKNYKED